MKEKLLQLQELAATSSDFKDGTSDFSQGFVAGSRASAELGLETLQLFKDKLKELISIYTSPEQAKAILESIEYDLGNILTKEQI